MTSHHNSGAPWDERIAMMLESDGTRALEIRDELATRDPDGLAMSLSRLIADVSAEEEARTKAAWLLKDTCNPVAIPFLESALMSPGSPSSLRVQILDTLERFAFANPLHLTDLTALDASLARGDEQKMFVSLLVTLATPEAKSILRQKVSEPDLRSTILSRLMSMPAAWVDEFLEAVVADGDDEGDIRAAIEERQYRRFRERLKSPENVELATDEMLSRVWAKRDVAFISWLADRHRLDADAKRTVLTLPEDSQLTPAQRKLLARAKRSANA
jgi:hypothetical protein